MKQTPHRTRAWALAALAGTVATLGAGCTRPNPAFGRGGSSVGDETSTDADTTLDASDSMSSEVDTGDGDGDASDTTTSLDTTDTTDSQSSTSVSTGDGDGDSGEDPALYLFATLEGFTGGFAEQGPVRDVVNGACAETLDAGGFDLPCEGVAAMISVNPNDELYKMPSIYGFDTTLPIFSAEGIIVAEGWEMMMGDDLNNSLMAAGVFETPTFFWTGATADGQLGFDTCNEWSSSSIETLGVVGTAAVTGATEWMTAASASCDNSYPLLCVCW